MKELRARKTDKVMSWKATKAIALLLRHEIVKPEELHELKMRDIINQDRMNYADHWEIEECVPQTDEGTIDGFPYSVHSEWYANNKIVTATVTFCDRVGNENCILVNF